MDSDWDGVERRRATRDHDLLIEIKALASSQKEMMGTHIDNFDKHVAMDTNEFEKLRDKLDDQRWYIALGVGIVAAVEFFKDKIFK